MKLLFADDERSLQELMSLELPRLGHEVTVCPDGLTAAAAIERNSYDCAIVDLDMPGLNGIEVIEKLKAATPEADAIVLTGKSSLQTAVSALRLGAYDYLTKPCKLVELEALLKRVAEKQELKNQIRAAQHRLHNLEGDSRLVGDSAPMEHVRQMISKVAPTESTVLVRGETGTGKELVARAIHDQSLRAERPFVAINCGALPESLIESELFGHRKGAFTGADDHRTGLFEVAGGGTLFLDEIGELPKGVQAKLLRFLESGEIRRIGQNEAFTVDVRVVCATHRNVEQMVRDGDFREDLMFRINTFEIALPPLRERKDDILPLARHLLRRFRPHLKPNDDAFSTEAADTLRGHAWPGNVRELANVVEHAAILSSHDVIQADDLPTRNFRVDFVQLKLGGPHTLRELETAAIQEALERHDGNKPKAAEELGVSLKTLYNKLNQMSNLEQSA